MIYVFVLGLLFIMVTDVLEDAEDYQDFWWILHVLGLAILSYLLLNGYGLWRRGQTLGKQLLGIAIVSSDLVTPVPMWKLVFLRAYQEGLHLQQHQLKCLQMSFSLF